VGLQENEALDDGERRKERGERGFPLPPFSLLLSD
jgi:hypothetical protein